MGGTRPPCPIGIGGGHHFPSLPLPLPSSRTPTRERGKPTPTRSRNPPLGAPHEAGPPPPPLLYIRGGGHPKDTQVDCLTVCGAPSTDFHLGHIVVVLRRSPASVTSSSPSSRRCADETLPRPQLDQEFEGRHRAEREQIAEVPCVRYLIGWIAKTFDYINRVT